METYKLFALLALLSQSATCARIKAVDSEKVEELSMDEETSGTVQPGNVKLASQVTTDLNSVMGRLHTEMSGFEAVPPEVWSDKKYYNKEVPVTTAEVGKVKKAIDECLKEQVDLVLSHLQSVNDFNVDLTSQSAYFATGYPAGKPQTTNVGRTLQSVSNTGHGLIVNLVGWLHKSYSPGKGQHYACSKRALGFGDYEHSFYSGAYNVATGIVDQLQRANEKMATLLGKEYTKSNCLEE